MWSFNAGVGAYFTHLIHSHNPAVDKQNDKRQECIHCLPEQSSFFLSYCHRSCLLLAQGSLFHSFPRLLVLVALAVSWGDVVFLLCGINKPRNVFLFSLMLFLPMQSIGATIAVTKFNDYNRVAYSPVSSNKLTFYNATMFTGILIQYDAVGSVVSLNVVSSADTSWFAQKFVKPRNWVGTATTFYNQTGALLRRDWMAFNKLNANSTSITLPTSAIRADFYIGGGASLILDTAKIVLNSTTLPKGSHEKLAMDIMKGLYARQALINNIETLLASKQFKKAGFLVLNEAYNELKNANKKRNTKIKMARLNAAIIADYGVGIDTVGKFIAGPLAKADKAATLFDGIGKAFLYASGSAPSKKVAIQLRGLSTAPNITFDDVATSHWARSHIRFLAKQGVIQGYADGLYRPYLSVSKKEFIKMVIASVENRQRGLAGNSTWSIPTTGGLCANTPAFLPITPTDWAIPYLIKACKWGSVKNNNEPTAFWFPNNPGWNTPITRGEAAHILLNAAELRPSNAAQQLLMTHFKDHASMTAAERGWYYGVKVAGLMQGYRDGFFRPAKTLTRAEAAQIIRLGLWK